jgi:NAD(P)H-hydrate epimerase
MIKLLPKGSILTPHPGEFKRLVGEWENDFDRLEKLQYFCQEYELNVVLKGAFSSVCDQMGRVHFNPTGNPGLATAGSGDVLAGMVGALLAQGLAPFHALQLGVYLHGLAGDEVIREMKISWLQASDIIAFLPKAIQSVMNRCL